MGRELDIYMLDSARAATFLLRDLESTELFDLSFRDFIQKRKQEIGETYNRDLEHILSVIGNDIQQISPDDLFEIIYFLSDEMYKKYELQEYVWDKYITELENLCTHYGLIHLYETTGSTAAHSFLIHMHHFLHHYPGLAATGDDSKEDVGGNLDSKTFHLFLNYMILLTLRIMEQRVDPDFEYDDISEEQMATLHKVHAETNEDLALLSMIDEDVENIADFWNTWKDSSRDPMANMVYDAENFFRNCIQMKDRITSEYPRIVVLDH